MESQSQTIIVAILTGLAIWLIKQFLQQFFTTRIDVLYGKLLLVETELTEHVNKCDEIPKEQITEALTRLTSSLDSHGEDIREIRDTVNQLLLRR